MNNFTIKSYNFRTEVANGYVQFGFQPKGYWSDVISVRLNSGYGRNDSWELEISNSSGARGKHEELNPETTISDLEATEYFLEAYAYARELAIRLEANKDKYTAYKNFKFRKNQERIEAERAEREAIIAADKEVGVKMATAIVEKMKADLKADVSIDNDFTKQVKVRLQERGCDKQFIVKAEYSSYNGVIKFRTKNLNGWSDYSAISKADAIELIANSSVEYYANN